MNVDLVPRQILRPEAYISADWYERERRELLGRVWTFVGFTGDFARPGDYRTVAAGCYPLAVLRDRDGGLNAFHNLCRHRGSRLLEGSGNAGTSIRCFYHNWTYDLSGRLVLVPQEAEQFRGLDKSCLGLKPAKVATWRNLVFAHPDPRAEALESWLAGFGERVGPHEIERLVEVADVTYRCKANWKLVIENFLDTYHLPFLHPQLGPVETAKRFLTLDEGALVGINYVTGAADKNKGDAGFRTFPGFTAKELASQDIAMLFPNTLFELVPEHVMFFRVDPVTPTLTRETLAFYYLGDDAEKPELAEQRQAAFDAWDRINRQDFPALYDLQAASHSPAARDLPPPSPLWEIASARFRERIDAIVGDA